MEDIYEVLIVLPGDHLLLLLHTGTSLYVSTLGAASPTDFFQVTEFAPINVEEVRFSTNHFDTTSIL